MMIAITIVITFMLGTAFLKCMLVLSLRDAAPGFLKRRNPVINALQHVLLMLQKFLGLGLIAFLLSWLFALVGSESGRQKRKRENSAKREHDMFQHYCLQ